MKKNFQAPSAPPYVWPVAIDPWQLSGPRGQGGGRGGGVVYQNRGEIPPVFAGHQVPVPPPAFWVSWRGGGGLP